MRSANKAIRRERHSTPTLDELKTLLSGVKVFSKLDLNQGYNQLELDDESRHITTFSTHVGLYRYCRLFFGVNSASEIFQETIRLTLSGIKGAVNIIDDICVLVQIKQAMIPFCGKPFNASIRKAWLSMHGNVFTTRNHWNFSDTHSEKMESNQIKTNSKTILDLPTPSSTSEVRSLLGMMNFYGTHHIPKHATLTHDLRQLTKKSSPFSWTEKHDAALAKPKRALSEATILAYFDPKKKTEIYTDGSSVGLSTVLTQEGCIIQFASRGLTSTEQRYSQTEREALAITRACEYFYIYLFGAPFTLYTDHKPLMAMLHNSQHASRGGSWGCSPMTWLFSIVQVMTNLLIISVATMWTWNPVREKKKIAEEYMNYVVTTSTPKAMTVEEVANETAKDPTLAAVTNALITNQWLNNDDKIDYQTFRTLYLCRSELSLAHNTRMVLKGRQIVLPQSLHRKAVNIAHSGPQGIVKTVALLREKSWFREMQSLVEQTVKKCRSCQVTTPTVTREPLQMSSLPKAPWTELSADFGHLPNGRYVLAVQDEYSLYPVVDAINSTSANCVIPRLDKIFSEFGYSETPKTDNGPPFNNTNFAQFCTHNGIKHRKITPLWPCANAETERFMRTLEKSMKSATTPNFKQAMHHFLLDYRTTPHTTTGVPPTTILFGCSLRTKLPHISETSQKDAPVRQRDTAQK